MNAGCTCEAAEAQRAPRSGQQAPPQLVPAADSGREVSRTAFARSRLAVKKFYSSNRCQTVIATLIFTNFIIQCFQMQIDPSESDYKKTWGWISDTFNIIFAIELAANLYGNFYQDFTKSGWNAFDTLVVSIGLLDLVRAPLPGPLKMIRMLRAFRVFRLFNRVPSLKKLVDSLRRALPGVVHAFLINLLMMCIYSVLAVDFFHDLHADCLTDPVVAQFPGAKTARGKCLGPDYYGNFFRALYTLFQVLTGESWSEAIVRPTLLSYRDSFVDTLGVAIFFVSFMLIHAVVLINVVVALLLDGMQQQEEPPPQLPRDPHDGANGDNAYKLDEIGALREEVVALRAQLTGIAEEWRSKATELLMRVEAISEL